MVIHDYIKQDSCTVVNTNDDYEITIPEGKRWMSDIFTSLPKGYFIDKTSTGSGGTTLALTEDSKIIVAVPRVMLVRNKVEQHKHVVGVSGEVKQSDLVSKIHSDKFICTYDSIPRLVSTMIEAGINPINYHLLIDEVHTVIREGGDFRSDVCNRLLNRIDMFASVTYLTATPTNKKYLPPHLATIPMIKLKWSNQCGVTVRKCKVGTDLNTKIARVVLDALDTDKGVPFLFYNSLTGIISQVKLLQKLRKISSNDIKIICADNEINRDRLKKELGKEFVPMAPVTVDEHGNQLQETHKVVFITRACFEGLDIYCERAYTIIVSDAKRKNKDHVKLDIAIDLPQIVGRFRNQCDENKKQVVFMWTEAFHKAEHDTEEAFSEWVKEKISEVPAVIESAYANAAGIGEGMLNLLRSSILTTEAEGKLEVNPLAFYAMMNAYEALNRDYVVMVDERDSSCAEIKLERVFSSTDTYTIPELSIQDKKSMDRSISYQKLLREYCDTLEMLDDCDVEQEQKLRDDILYYEQIAPDLPDIVSELGIEKIKAYSYRWKDVGNMFRSSVGIRSLKLDKRKVADEIGVTVGKFYSMKYLKDRFKVLYEKYEIDTTAKATDVLDYFVAKRTTQRNQVGYFIVSEQ